MQRLVRRALARPSSGRNPVDQVPAPSARRHRGPVRHLAGVVAVASALTGVMAITSNPQDNPVEASSSGFTAMAPKRIVDTRKGLGASRLGAQTTRNISLAGVVPAEARAVAINVTATAPSAQTFLTVWPRGQSRPDASNLNVARGQTRPNAVMVGLGDSRSISVYNRHGNVDVIIDVMGYFTDGFTGIAPTRVMDTRTSGFAKFTSASTRSTRVAGVNGVPSNATAVAVNLTAAQASRQTFMTAWPRGASRPSTSNLNVGAGGTVANMAVVGVGSGGQISVYNHNGSVHGLVDVLGWFDSTGGYQPLSPTRHLDTRDGSCGLRLGPGETRRVNLGQSASSAKILNVTAVGATRSTFLTVWPAGQSRPATSNLNVPINQATPNMVAVGTGVAGQVDIFNNAGHVDVLVDVYGEFAGSTPSGTPVKCQVVINPAPSNPAPSNPAPSNPAPSNPAPSAGNYPNIASNFSKSQWLDDGGRIPAFTDQAGAFRTFCAFSHMAYDDPIIYPNQPGASHLHMFFGNRQANARSTYQSLRSGGDSTCQGGPLNRTGYWTPTLHNAAGKVVVPEFFEIYYKGSGSESAIRNIRTNPNGLRIVAGFDHAKSTAINHKWICGNYSNNALRIPNCPSGEKLRVELRFPMCWNGRDLDSSDHRGHMAYGTGGGGWVTVQGGCPSSHPVQLPEMTLFANFVSDGNTANWYLSSDRMPGMNHANGSTFHADWFGAWDNQVQETWTQKCVRDRRTCVWGEIGDGTRLKNNPAYSGPRLLDTPAR
jgi:hypothetical protein